MPPLDAVALKVTLAPAQILPGGVAAILTSAATFGFTVIVIVFEVAGEPVAQVALDVITHFITSPLASALELNVALLVPTFAPFSFH